MAGLRSELSNCSDVLVILHCIVNPHLTSLSMASFHSQIHLMKRALSDIVVHSIFAELIFLVEES